ncbi:hypothetical protein FDZ71_03795, partial [bacterium]
MKVALVWPFGFETNSMVPLSLAYLKSNLASTGHEIRLFDFSLRERNDFGEFKSFLESFVPDVVGVSSLSSTFLHAIEILEFVKTLSPGTITVMGGEHASVYPDKTMDCPHLDYLLMGEGEKSFGDFLNALEAKALERSSIPGLVYRENGRLVKTPIALLADLDSLKYPDYDFIDLEGYIKRGYRYIAKGRNAPILLTRGCPYSCE